MKKIILICIIIPAILPLYSYEKLSMKVASLYLEKSGERRYMLETSIEHRGLMKELFEDSGVTIPVEDKIVTGSFSENRLSEKNFLFAGMNFDINNDGDYDDVYSVSEKSGTFFIENLQVEQLVMPKMYNRLQGLSYYNGKKSPKIYKIGENGNPFTIYIIDQQHKKITVGIGTKTEPVKFIEFPNPCIQVIVIKNAENLSVKPAYHIAGEKNQSSFTNEKIFEDQGDEWVSAVWAVKKINVENGNRQKFNFTIENIEPPFAVVVYGNLSLEKGLRLRTVPMMKIVK